MKLRKKGIKVRKNEQKVSTILLGTGWKNQSSSVCNFFGFFKLWEGTSCVVIDIDI